MPPLVRCRRPLVVWMRGRRFSTDARRQSSNTSTPGDATGSTKDDTCSIEGRTSSTVGAWCSRLDADGSAGAGPSSDPGSNRPDKTWTETPCADPGPTARESGHRRSSPYQRIDDPDPKCVAPSTGIPAATAPRGTEGACANPTLGYMWDCFHLLCGKERRGPCRTG